ncbi:hypothetical protein AGOR_G00072690 [Albula goreensis]|uniref:Ig-like domain-containing protein n=1 Tax=Albula goreensis TaxID=1534307 RepID=A0A8T3DN56_9TELE|nr:hypothetical protein AGOR_G00072690 [Albula goreensis]
MDWSCYFLLFVWKTQYVVSAKDSEATIHGSLGTYVLFPNISEDMKNISDVTLRKNSIYLFKWKKKQVNQSYVDRLTCFENKTLKLDALEERDAGRYEMEWFDMEGRSVQKAVINVILTCFKGSGRVHADLGSPVTVFGESLVGISNVSNAKWEKDGLLVAQLNGSRPVYTEEYQGRVKILTTGECNLIRAHTSDEGYHTLEVPDGYFKLRWTTQLIIKVPRPVIKYTCQPDGKAQYSCSVNSAIQTLWILNGTFLEESVLDKNELVLDSFTGELFCALKENLEQNVSVTFTCTGASTETSYIFAACFTVCILVALSVAVFCAANRLRHAHEQSPQMILAVPAEVLQTPEVTDLDEFPPPPPSVLEEVYCNDVNKPQGMSTFV